jgi:hypothetical protein
MPLILSSRTLLLAHNCLGKNYETHYILYLLFCGFLSLIFKYIHLHLVSRLRTSGTVTLLRLCIVGRGQDKTYLQLSPTSQTPTIYALPETPIVITAQSKV